MNSLGEMTWKEVEVYLEGRQDIIIPVGACEQHGPVGQLRTDNELARWIARYISAATDIPVAPLLPYGMSIHHLSFPGTISIGETTFMAFLEDVLESLRKHGFRRFIIVNGHGGNDRPIEYLAERFKKRYPDITVVHDFLNRLFYCKNGELGVTFQSFDEEVSHAGAAEISLFWGIHPVSVTSTDHINDDMVTPGRHGQGTQGASPEYFRKIFPTGSKGDQRKADYHKGKYLRKLIEQELDSFIKSEL